MTRRNAREAGRAARAEICQAAEELWALGHLRESLLLWQRALEQLGQALNEKEDAPAELTHAVHETSARGAELARATHATASDPGRRAWLEAARTLSQRALRELAPEPPAAPRDALPAIAGALALSGVLLVFLLRLTAPAATASGWYNAEFMPENALDGDLKREWLLPDGQSGYLDVALPRRRTVRGVEVVNGHNGTYSDRAARTVRISVLDDDLEVDSADLHFSAIPKEPSTQTARLAGKLATRVRIEVREYFGLGAALAEVRVW